MKALFPVHGRVLSPTRGPMVHPEYQCTIETAYTVETDSKGKIRKREKRKKQKGKGGLYTL